jgi:hypothetical protein
MIPRGKIIYIKGVGVDTNKISPINISSDAVKKIEEKFSIDVLHHLIFYTKYYLVASFKLYTKLFL